MKSTHWVLTAFLVAIGSAGRPLAAQFPPVEKTPELAKSTSVSNNWDVLDRLATIQLSKTDVLANWRWMPEREAGIAKADELFSKIPKSGARVLVLPIDDKVTTSSGMIDEWQADWVKKKIEEAKASPTPPDLIVLEIDTDGGRVDSSINIGRALDESGLPTVALVQHLAFSGGSIVTSSCMRIYMRDGSKVGGAQVIFDTGETPTGDLKEKLNSYLRSEFRASAKKNGHPVSICQAMTDRELSVKEIYLLDKDGITRRYFASPDEISDILFDDYKLIAGMVRLKDGSDTLITLDNREALECGLSKATIAGIDDILANQLGLSGFVIDRKIPSRIELTRRWFLHPVIAVILVLLALVCVYAEVTTPGIGIWATLAVIFFGMFLWTQYVSQSASYVEIALFIIGVALLLVEVLAIPGFGVTGIAGLACIFISVILSFIPDSVQTAPFTTESSPAASELFYSGLNYAFVALTALCIGTVIFISQWDRLPGVRRLQVTAVLEGSSHGETENKLKPLIGKELTVIRDCRPAGQVESDGLPIDADSNGEYIESGTRVTVVDVVEGRLIVRRKS